MPTPSPLSSRSTVIALVLAAVTSCAIVATAAEPEPPAGLLSLRNGSAVAGRLMPDAGGEVIRWQSDEFVRPFEFELGGLASLTFPPADPRLDMVGPFAIELHNGDIVSGRISGWADGFLQLVSPRLGTLRIHETALRRIDRIGDNPSLLFAGLTGLTDWKSVSGTWNADGTQLWTNEPETSLTGDFRIPSRAVVEFELSWEKTPDFVIALAIDPQAPETPSVGWRLETWDSTLALVCEREDIASVEPVQSLDDGSRRLRLLAYLDQPAHTIHLYRPDGTRLTEMVLAPSTPDADKKEQDEKKQDAKAGDAASADSRNTGILIRNLSGHLRVERLRVARWNGTLPLAQDKQTSRFALDDGSLLLGQFDHFDAGSNALILREGQQEQSAPIERLITAEFAGTAPLEPQPLTAVLQDQMRLSGKLVEVRDGSVVLQSPAFADAVEFDRALLRSLAASRDGEAAGGGNAAPTATGRIGRLVLGEHRLTGSLVPGQVPDDQSASCLVWHPQLSRTASPFRPSASGRIVYRERKPAPPRQQQAQPVRRPPQNVFEQFGQLFVRNLEKPQPAQVAPDKEHHDIHLLTGDVIPCEITGIDQHGVRFHSSAAEVELIPHDKIKAVVFDRTLQGPSLEEAKRERLLTLPRNQKGSPPTHLLYSTTGDFLRCRLDSLDDKELHLELHLAEIAVPRERISHVIWLHPPNLLAVNDDADDTADDGKENAAVDNEAGSTDEQPAAAAVEPAEAPALHQTQVLLANRNRATFVPQEVTDETIGGRSDVVGPCRFALPQIDEIVFGSDIEVATADLPYHQWVLQPAVEPLFVQDSSGGGMPANDGTASPLVGKPAPDFRLELLGGGTFVLSEAKGKVIVLDFWATWCGPCMLTMPLMEEAMQEFDPEKVQLVSVNLEERGDQVQEVLARHKLNPTVALDIDGVVARRYQVDSIPQLIIVDAEGNVARLYVGGGQNVVDQFKAALTELLDAQK